MPDEMDYGDLAIRVKERREALRLKISEAADRAGFSRGTWLRIEKGLPVRGLSYAGVEVALRWSSGSVRRILAGDEPTPLGRSPGDPERTEADELIERVQRSGWARTTKDIVIAAIRVAADAERDRSLHANSA